jgi:hypothetical protein
MRGEVVQEVTDQPLEELLRVAMAVDDGGAFIIDERDGGASISASDEPPNGVHPPLCSSVATPANCSPECNPTFGIPELPAKQTSPWSTFPQVRGSF